MRFGLQLRNGKAVDSKDGENVEYSINLMQKNFADFYIETGNQTEAARRAGYKQPHVQGNRLLDNVRVQAYIEQRLEEIDGQKIADAKEIMEYFTSVMRGEIKDQFGLDAPLAERTKAAVELAKRKIDVGQKQEGGGITIVNNIPRPDNSKSD